MSEIHKALAIFGLEPGASQEAIQRRYKRLIMVWHPDRFPTEDGKKDAEEELKKINNANDVLKKHFASGHRANGCECQKPAAEERAEQRTHGPGPGPQKKPDDAEAAAKRRDEERRRKAAAEEAARRAAEQQQEQQKKAAETTFAQAQRQQEELKWNKIRWQIAAGEAALFIGLCIFGNVGYGIKQWWHDVTWKWQADQEQRQRDQQHTDTSTSTGNQYVPPYMLPPTQNTSPYENTQPPPSYNTSPAPPINTNPPGFNWKPLGPAPDNNSLLNTPPSKLGDWKPLGEQLKVNGLGDPGLKPSPLLAPSTTNTSTTTDHFNLDGNP